MNLNEGKLELLTDLNSVLVLVDYQPTMIKSVSSGDKTIIKNAAIFAAKAASILDVPVVLSSINPHSNGDVFPEITEIFPDQEVFAREIPSFDAFEDDKTFNAVKETNRNKIVVSGLWTSMCFTYTALHAIKEGYDVYGLIDAGGDSTEDAHNYGVKRMIQAGVIPITLESLVSEWMHDWNHPKAGELVENVYSNYGAMIGLK
ncbi:isochorismatase family protein [Methanobacterium sp. SMA-27]|uniref:isochorismatase family protein n=1 Tax=Methanobacterium sp. SMA-27 TaxID=1495336 RepID=UPI001E51112B|nr:isochorismatase family protein [Methanobacterium sp. SMA-27]